MRYEAGVHFPTDILTGAAVGTLIGWGIPWLHTQKKQHMQLSADPFRRMVYLTGEF
jgi:membrane-associated phospholipid phosphatase